MFDKKIHKAKERMYQMNDVSRQQKIEAAKQRIAELERLIKYWQK